MSLIKKMDMPLVSIVIPTHNGEAFLEHALNSALDQTYANTEVVVVNDGSIDGTEGIILKYKAKDARIVYVKNEDNLGFVKSLNKGISGSGGRYIARLDDDDRWADSQKIAKQVAFLEQHSDYVLVGGGVIKVNGAKKEVVRYMFPEKDQDIRKAILVDNLFVHSAVMFRRDAFLKVGGYDEQFGFFADRELWLKLGTVGKFYNFPEYFIYYLDKEDGVPQYKSRNNQIRRKLKINIALRQKYRHRYPGFYKSLILCIASYIYSYLPYRQKIRWIVFRARIFIFGRPPYSYSMPSNKPK